MKKKPSGFCLSISSLTWDSSEIKKEKNLMTRFVSFFLNPLPKKQQAREIFFLSFHHTAVANPILKMRGWLLSNHSCCWQAEMKPQIHLWRGTGKTPADVWLSNKSFLMDNWGWETLILILKTDITVSQII